VGLVFAAVALLIAVGGYVGLMRGGSSGHSATYDAGVSFAQLEAKYDGPLPPISQASAISLCRGWFDGLLQGKSVTEAQRADWMAGCEAAVNQLRKP
jgi:hypothetical protein